MSAGRPFGHSSVCHTLASVLWMMSWPLHTDMHRLCYQTPALLDNWQCAIHISYDPKYCKMLGLDQGSNAEQTPGIIFLIRRIHQLPTRHHACLGGAVSSIMVRAAWLWWSASPGSRSGLAWSLCQVIALYALRLKFSGRHRGFNGVLFNLWPLANTGFRDAQY